MQLKKQKFYSVLSERQPSFSTSPSQEHSEASLKYTT